MNRFPTETDRGRGAELTARRPRGRGAVALGLAVVLAAATGAAASPAPQDIRSQDLEIVEDILVRAVQTVVDRSIASINQENRQIRQTAANDVSAEVEPRYDFRASGRAGARGMFLEDYGVLFTVQVPSVTYSPTIWRVVSAAEGGSSITVIGGLDDSQMAVEFANQARVRGNLMALERSLDQLHRRYAEELADETNAALTRELEDKISEIRRLAGQLEISAAAGTAPIHEVAEAREAERGGRPAGPGDRTFGLTGSFDAEYHRRALETAERQKIEIQNEIIESVVDSLAQYGHVVHGLRPADRLAVVLQPASYLYFMERWRPATERAPEFIISVRHEDIEELRRGEITEAEFGQRIRVESRLGQPREGLEAPGQ